MEVETTKLPGVVHLVPRIFADPRGFFLETYSTRSFPEEQTRFVQDNLSYSSKGTLRGMHLQQPHAQGKLVMAITGTIWDVAADVRVGSPTFGQWVAFELSSEKKDQLYVPPGYAHGFCVLSETAHVLYKCTELYQPGAELGIRFDDPDLAIPWPVQQPLLSAKDAAALRLAEIPHEQLPQFSADAGSGNGGAA